MTRIPVTVLPFGPHTHPLSLPCVQLVRISLLYEITHLQGTLRHTKYIWSVTEEIWSDRLSNFITEGERDPLIRNGF